jgi:pimeloyl-ACP methyl ester carboxylesterase
LFGHGDSPKPDEWDAYSTEEFIKDFELIYMRTRTPHPKINVIVAHSYGVSITVEWYVQRAAVSKASFDVSGFVLLGASIEPPKSSTRKNED